MFWGWTDDWQAYKDRVAKEKLKWEKRHPIKAKLNKFKGFVISCTLITTVTLWLFVLPVYGIIKLFN